VQPADDELPDLLVHLRQADLEVMRVPAVDIQRKSMNDVLLGRLSSMMSYNA
jgi:hypothetical protein